MPRVRIYLLLVMTLIVVTGFAGVTLITHNADRQALASAFDQKVATASASLLKKTMALLPDGKVKENQAELFRLALIRVPEITYLAILDGRRKILVEAGNRPAGLADVDPSGARQLAGGLVLHFTPIRSVPDGLYIVIGVRQDTPQILLLEPVVIFLAALLALVWIGVGLILALQDIYLQTPFRMCRNVMERIKAGDFRARMTTDSDGLFTALAGTFNLFICRVNGHFTIMQILSDDLEAKNSPDNLQVRKRLNAHMAQLLNRFHFADGPHLPALHARTPHDIRLPMFMFSVVEFLPYAFLPDFFARMHQPGSGPEKLLFIAIMLATSFTGAALAAATSRYWCRRFDTGTILPVCALLFSLAAFGTAHANTAISMVTWRTISGIAFGMAAASCQNYVSRFAAEKTFSSTLSGFFRPQFAGAITGLLVGGTLAGLFDPSVIFALTAGVALLTGLFIRVVLTARLTLQLAPAPEIPLPPVWLMVGNIRALTFSILAILPARIIMSGLLFYITPLYLTDLGFRFQDIGGVLALAFSIIFLLTPMMARLADDFGLTVLSIFAGLIVPGAVAIALTEWQNGLTVIAIVIASGLGQAFIIAPAMSALSKICHAAFSGGGGEHVLTAYRTLENSGIAIGPIVAALLVNQVGFSRAIFVLGMASLASALLFGSTFAIIRLQATPGDPDAPR